MLAARVQYNAEMNMHSSPVELTPVSGTNQPLDLRVLAGIILMEVSASTNRLLKNGLRYRLEEVQSTSLMLAKVGDDDKLRAQPFQLEMDEVAKINAPHTRDMLLQLTGADHPRTGAHGTDVASHVHVHDSPPGRKATTRTHRHRHRSGVRGLRLES
jgi:hypothetical protein